MIIMLNNYSSSHKQIIIMTSSSNHICSSYKCYQNMYVFQHLKKFPQLIKFCAHAAPMNQSSTLFSLHGPSWSYPGHHSNIYICMWLHCFLTRLYAAAAALVASKPQPFHRLIQQFVSYTRRAMFPASSCYTAILYHIAYSDTLK